jgi:uncharacterized protein YdhG (YjbR/CyaY superfamily)
MQSTAKTVDEYLALLPDDRKEPMTKLRNVIKKNIPKGFEECMSYGMIGYVVPHSIYPAGYHCTPHLPLPFANIASQKNFISFYHMCIYGDAALKTWFEDEYKKAFTAKLDMGKSCTRFKKMEHIPYELIGELMKKITVKQWIETYERLYKSNVKKSK